MAFLASIGQIFVTICLPLFILMGVGWLLDRKFTLDLSTLVKLNIYVLVPCFIFVRVYSSKVVMSTAAPVFLFTLTVLACLLMLSVLVSLRQSAAQRKTLMLAMFYNCGNYGIPLTALAFGPQATEIQVFALLAMNISTFSLGMLIAASQGKDKPSADAPNRQPRAPWLLILRQPSIYAISLAFLLKPMELDIASISWLWTPLSYTADALIGFALLTLGVQLSKTRPSKLRGPVSCALLLKLAIAPLIAWPLTMLFGFEPETARILIAGAAAPTAINTALLAHEFDGDSQFAASAVFYSTLASVVTVSVVLALLGAG
ncbi:MAG: AEC family transporter [Verrucomicrobiae bacterium]|nr:AEC family transporter [Verrucomicrobiae bacterium]